MGVQSAQLVAMAVAMAVQLGAERVRVPLAVQSLRSGARWVSKAVPLDIAWAISSSGGVLGADQYENRLDCLFCGTDDRRVRWLRRAGACCRCLVLPGMDRPAVVTCVARHDPAVQVASAPLGDWRGP